MSQGRYLAELTRELFADLEETKYQMTEYRCTAVTSFPTETLTTNFAVVVVIANTLLVEWI